jgi:hypothetical protein
MAPERPPPSRIRRQAPTLVWFLILWVGAELGAAFLLPLVVPGRSYLDRFQPARADSSVATFLRGEHILLPDSSVGWRSAPLTREGPWQTDSRGARATGRWEWGDPAALNVLFSGSSLINGGTTISNDETLSAALEGPWIRTLNFGTMLYGVDQTLLDYRTRLRAFRPDVLVVGVDRDALASIQNVWVPLRRSDEVLMPFVKPRFRPAGDSLELVRADPWELLPLEGREGLLRFIREEDGLVARFHAFVRYRQTPLMALGLRVYRGIRSRVVLPAADPLEELLLDRILKELRRTLDADGVRLVLLATPPGRSATGPELEMVRSRVQRWRGAGFQVVDGGRAFVDHRVPGVELFLEDGEHYTPAGNQVLAAALAEVLAR